MHTFKTTRGAPHGHPEITLQFAEEPVIPKSERLLLSYFDDAMAQGAQFKPGQTVGIGGHVLRFKQRADGSLGVEEPVPSPREEWVEQVDRTVREVMFQRYICDSVQLPLSFPPVRGTCLVAACAEGAEALVLTRVVTPPEAHKHVSGWMIACTEDHTHGERTQVPLLALSAIDPFAVQFLALPPDTVALLTPPGHGAVFHAGNEITPVAGSYLARLNAR
jgi:hypothetical protein